MRFYGGEGSSSLGCGGAFCCSVPQYGRGQGESGGTHTHTHTLTRTRTRTRTRNAHTHTHRNTTGTHMRMLHLPFSDPPLKKCPNQGNIGPKVILGNLCSKGIYFFSCAVTFLPPKSFLLILQGLLRVRRVREILGVLLRATFLGFFSKDQGKEGQGHFHAAK